MRIKIIGVKIYQGIEDIQTDIIDRFSGNEIRKSPGNSGMGSPAPKSFFQHHNNIRSMVEKFLYTLKIFRRSHFIAEEQ